MKTILFIALVACALGTLADIDARIPEKTAFAAVVDFDALRPQLPQMDAWIREGFLAESTNATDRSKNQAAAYDLVSRKTMESLAGCAFSLSDVHWAAVAVRNKSLKISRNQQFNSLRFQVALKAANMPWNRILELAERHGWDCERKRVFGQTLYNCSWYSDREYSSPILFSVMPAADDFAFASNGDFDLWNAYFDSAKTDGRYADLGQLEPGEVVRVVLADFDFPVRDSSLREIAGEMLPGDLRPLAAQIQRGVLSLYLADAKAGARLRIAFTDSAAAEQIRAMAVQELDRKFASNARIPFHPTVSVEGPQVILDTGRVDAASSFRLFLGPIGEISRLLLSMSANHGRTKD